MLEILIAWWYFHSTDKDDRAAEAARLTTLLSDIRSGAGATVDEAEWKPWFDQVQAWLLPHLDAESPASIVDVDIRRTGPGRCIAAGSVDVSFRGGAPVRSWFIVDFDPARAAPVGDVLDFDPRPPSYG